MWDNAGDATAAVVVKHVVVNVVVSGIAATVEGLQWPRMTYYLKGLHTCRGTRVAKRGESRVLHFQTFSAAELVSTP